MIFLFCYPIKHLITIKYDIIMSSALDKLLFPTNHFLFRKKKAIFKRLLVIFFEMKTSGIIVYMIFILIFEILLRDFLLYLLLGKRPYLNGIVSPTKLIIIFPFVIFLLLKTISLLSNFLMKTTRKIKNKKERIFSQIILIL